MPEDHDRVTIDPPPYAGVCPHLRSFIRTNIVIQSHQFSVVGHFGRGDVGLSNKSRRRYRILAELECVGVSALLHLKTIFELHVQIWPIVWRGGCTLTVYLTPRKCK